MLSNYHSSKIIILLIGYIAWAVTAFIMAISIYTASFQLSYTETSAVMLQLQNNVEILKDNMALFNISAIFNNIVDIAFEDSKIYLIYFLILFLGLAVMNFAWAMFLNKKAYKFLRLMSDLKLKERYLNKRIVQEQQIKEVNINKLLDNVNDYYIRLNQDYRILHINTSAKMFFNQLTTVERYNNIFLIDIIPDIKSTNFTHLVDKVWQTQVSKTSEIYLTQYKKWLLVRMYFEENAIGVYFSDITAKKEAEIGIESGVSLLKQLMNTSLDSMALVDLNWRYLLTNQKWLRSFGMEDKKVQGRQVLETIPSFLNEVEIYQKELVRGSTIKLKEFKTVVLGKEEWLRFEVTPFRNEEDKITGFIISAVFTTQVRKRRRQAQKQRETERQLAYHDMLTGLPNRQLFHDRLNEALTNSYRNLKKAALLFVDLDGFKAVNDTLGHDVGDRLLQDVAQRLQANVRGSDTVSRLGGDEFTIILTEIDQTEDVATVASKIINVLAEPYDYGEGIVARVTGSIGIAMYPKDGSSSAALIKCADESMYKAKNSGKNNYVFYEANEVEVTGSQFRPEDIQKAINTNELLLHYQGYFDCNAGKVYGVECLLRWNHPQYGLLRAGQFLSAVEQDDIMVQVGNFTLTKACQQLHAWEEQGNQGIMLSVNVSPREFQDKGLVKRLEKLTKEYSIKPNTLGLEISEKIILNHTKTISKILKDLKGLGIALIVENVDKEGISLEILKECNIDMLKIDYSYISQIGKQKESEEAIKSFIKMAKSIGVEPAADCVETPAQQEFLNQNGCFKMQGFLFGRPSKPTKHFNFSH